MDARARLEQLQGDWQAATILLTANHLGLFVALGDGARTPAELAGALGLDERALETVLLALAGEGIVVPQGGRFALAPDFAPLLLPGRSESLAAIVEHNYHLLQRWVRLREVVRTGRPLPRPGGRRDPAELRAFICGMADLARLSSEEVAARLDLSPFRTLIDVGGGPGTSSIVFARHYPRLTCTVFDLPEVVAIAREEIERAGLEDRVRTAAGDYFSDELGEGFDAAYVASIIHSMGPEPTAALFAKTRRALAPGGTIVIKEFFLDDTRTRPPLASRFSVNMLIGTEDGKSYTWAETRELLEEAGFGDFRQMELAQSSGLLVARAQD